MHSGKSISYAELDARSNRIARLLREHGAGRGKLVGLCVDRGNDMLCTLMAVLKSGAAYVPIDPAFPVDRLHYMVDDAKPVVIVTQDSHRGLFTEGSVPLLLLDQSAVAIDAAPAAALPADAESARPDDCAYVIYTSGTTGKPKGVIVPHRAVVNFLTTMASQPGIRANDRLVAVTTLSFDIAVLELLLPLTTGAA